ncbi:unnamed protein product [Cladocopium goreaui]|uniref:Uncharacterized protein n=1 Tax=Cladocopium goreaui TaxID=2562237 RepID=A0A9P1DJW4_9DINO|nr:unnamed protein product [Cladocopium goreaui]|mmetsp:Transcript_50528/g.110248  ORF Transcript_50528/g.110248 Transcript_50528/m.110248 type:complete len:192 (-) Transcript_50528:48-623(-)
MPRLDAVSMAPKKSEKGYTGPEDEQHGKDTKKEASRISRGQVEETSAEMSVRFLINERFNRKIPYHPEMKASTLFSFLERYLKSEGVYAWRNKPGIGLECEGPWLIFGGRALLPDGEEFNFFGRTGQRPTGEPINGYLAGDRTVSSLGLRPDSEIAIAPKDVMDVFFPYEDDDEGQIAGDRAQSVEDQSKK